MAEDFPGFTTLAVEAAAQVGINLNRDMPHPPPYNQWEFYIPLQAGRLDHKLVFQISYHTETGEEVSERILGSYNPWPPTDKNIAEYKQSVKNAIVEIKRRAGILNQAE